jgi:hypothetical protein
VIFPVLELREEKWTSLRVGGGKIDFFLMEACFIVCPVTQRNSPSFRESVVFIY